MSLFFLFLVNTAKNAKSCVYLSFESWEVSVLFCFGLTKDSMLHKYQYSYILMFLY